MLLLMPCTKAISMTLELIDFIEACLFVITMLSQACIFGFYFTASVGSLTLDVIANVARVSS